jgi:hypothetical protein
MRANTGFHADKAGQRIRKPRHHLASEKLAPQRYLPTDVEGDQVKGVLADNDSDRRHLGRRLADHDSYSFS